MVALAFAWLGRKVKRLVRQRPSWGLLWGFCKSLLWRADNAVSGGVVTLLTLSKLFPENPLPWKVIGWMALASLFWALLRLGWIEYSKNNGLTLAVEKYYFADS